MINVLEEHSDAREIVIAAISNNINAIRFASCSLQEEFKSKGVESSTSIEV